MVVDNSRLYYYSCPNCEWRILNNQIREISGYEDKIHFCERCGSKLDKINLTNLDNTEENNSETTLNSIEHPVEIIAEDHDIQIGFIDNLTLVLARMIYFNIRYLEKTLDKKFDNVELDVKLLNLLSGALMPILHNDVEEDFLDKLNEITLADFYSNLTKIHNKVKLYPIFRQRFIIYLRWLVKQVFILVSELWNKGLIDKFEAMIFRDLNTYDFNKIQSKMSSTINNIQEKRNFRKGGIIGSSKIHLADGRDLTLLKLMEECNLGNELYCFSLDRYSNIVISKIEKIKRIRDVSKLIKITLDDSTIIYCDYNCAFINRNNKLIEVVHLHNEDSLMPLKIYYAKDISVANRSYKDKRLKLEDYLVVYNPRTGTYDYIHNLADDYNIRDNVYTKDMGKIRHHIDFDKYNNNPSNIRRTFFKEHFEIHSKFASERAVKGEIGWGRAHKLYPDFYSEMASENIRKLHRDPQFQKRHSKRASKNISDYIKSEAFYDMTRAAGKRGKEYLVKYNKSEKGRKKSSEIGKQGKMICKICGQLVYGRAEMIEHYKNTHPPHWLELQNKFQKASKAYVRSEKGRKNQSEKAKNGKMVCHKCGKMIIGASELKKHYAEVHNELISCPFCNELFKGNGGLSTHIRYCPENPDHKVREVGCFPCPLCDKIFGSQRGLSGHLTRSHKVINHKIISIEIIECEPLKIYNLCLEDSNNFGLSAGIFIHT